jgi:hypothetical protein
MGASADQIELEVRETLERMDENLGELSDVHDESRRAAHE